MSITKDKTKAILFSFPFTLPELVGPVSQSDQVNTYPNFPGSMAQGLIRMSFGKTG